MYWIHINEFLNILNNQIESWRSTWPHSSLLVHVLGIFSLQFEADRRAFIITINSFGTELTKEDRAKLYPRCGDLYPYGLQLLAKADDYDQVRQVADIYGVSGEKKNV